MDIYEILGSLRVKEFQLIQNIYFYSKCISGVVSTTICIIFWDFLMFYQISFHHKWNDARLLLINMVHTSCLRSYQRRKIKKLDSVRSVLFHMKTGVNLKYPVNDYRHPHAESSRTSMMKCPFKKAPNG